MGAHSVLSNAPTNAPVISFKHFRSGSLFESSSNHYFLRLAGYKSSIKGVQIVHRTQIICAVNPQKVDDRSADVNKLDVKSTRKKLAVFISGGGSNFKAIHAATCDGCVLGDVVVLVTNKTDCGGAVYAREHGIPVIQFPKTKNV